MSTTNTGRQCQAQRADGAPCLAWALTGSAFCYNHDPARAADRAASRQAGGRARHGRQLGPTGAADPVTLTGPADVLALVAAEVNAVRGLEVSVSRARAIGYLSSVFLTGWESTELEARLSALEERLNHADSKR